MQENLPDQPAGDNADNDGQEQSSAHPHKRRRRVRKRIRIKKRTNPKRKIKKYLERLIWLVVIALFIATLVIMIKQLEIVDPDMKSKKKKSSLDIKINKTITLNHKVINKHFLFI